MKMFKKFVAVMMAAVLSMALLTACGGGSGSGAGAVASSKLVSILGGHGEYYIVHADIGGENRAIEAGDGETEYWEDCVTGEKQWQKGNIIYEYKNGVGRMNTSSEGTESKDNPLKNPFFDGLKNIEIKNDYELTINGEKKTYYAEILEYEEEKMESPDDRFIFFFEGNKPVYFAYANNKGNTIDMERTFAEIVELKAEIPADLMDLPSDVEFVPGPFFDRNF